MLFIGTLGYTSLCFHICHQSFKFGASDLRCKKFSARMQKSCWSSYRPTRPYIHPIPIAFSFPIVLYSANKAGYLPVATVNAFDYSVVGHSAVLAACNLVQFVY